jgi:hypothetical protein
MLGMKLSLGISSISSRNREWTAVSSGYRIGAIPVARQTRSFFSFSSSLNNLAWTGNILPVLARE